MIPVEDIRDMVKKANEAGETYASLSQRTGVGATVLLRFVNEGTDIGGHSIEKIATAFGLMPRSKAEARLFRNVLNAVHADKTMLAKLEAVIDEHEAKGK